MVMLAVMTIVLLVMHSGIVLRMLESKTCGTGVVRLKDTCQLESTLYWNSFTEPIKIVPEMCILHGL
jgi:hypothetical protein